MGEVTVAQAADLRLSFAFLAVSRCWESTRHRLHAFRAALDGDSFIMGRGSDAPRGCAAVDRVATFAAALLLVVVTTASGNPKVSAAPGADWVTDCPSKAFCFSRPADMVLQPGQAIDSLVARYRAPTLALSFDFGRYATSLAHLKQPTERAMNIDGRRARLLRAGQDVVLVVPRVHETSATPTQLTMSLRFEGEVSLPLATRIFESISFAPRR